MVTRDNIFSQSNLARNGLKYIYLSMGGYILKNKQWPLLSWTEASFINIH